MNKLNSGKKFKFAASSIATVVILIGTGRQYINLITDIRTIVQLKAKVRKKQTNIAQEVQILSSIQDELKSLLTKSSDSVAKATIDKESNYGV